MPTRDESKPEDRTVAEPLPWHRPRRTWSSSETFEITVADLRVAELGENSLSGTLDDYPHGRAINIAAHRRPLRHGG